MKRLFWIVGLPIFLAACGAPGGLYGAAPAPSSTAAPTASAVASTPTPAATPAPTPVAVASPPPPGATPPPPPRRARQRNCDAEHAAGHHPRQPAGPHALLLPA